MRCGVFLLLRSWARHENPTPCLRRGNSQVVLLWLCCVQLCVKNNFAEKEQNVQLKKKNTVTTQMFNVLHFRWTGHLPLAILYAPSASIWLLENSLHTLLVRQPWRKLPHKTGRYCFWEQVLTQRGPFPAQSCLASTMCVVLAVSLLLLSTRLLYLERSRPLFRKRSLFG